MPIETLPPGSTQQPDSDGEFVPNLEEIDRQRLVNYSEQETYLYRRATAVALEVFGDDFSRSGLFFTEAGSDHDVPYLVVCEGKGIIMSYNLLNNGEAAARGLGGVVVNEAEAEQLRAAAPGPIG